MARTIVNRRLTALIRLAFIFNRAFMDKVKEGNMLVVDLFIGCGWLWVDVKGKIIN
jgi:hypothetical protein